MSEIQRPTWPQKWMNIAREISEMSYDSRLKVGAIIVPVDNTGILSLGFNGNAHGLPNKRDSEEEGKAGFIHAEQNCFYKLDYRHPSQKVLYVLYSPCPECAKGAIQCKINRVVYDKPFRDTRGIDILNMGGIEVYTLDEAIFLAQQGIWGDEHCKVDRKVALTSLRP